MKYHFDWPGNKPFVLCQNRGWQTKTETVINNPSLTQPILYDKMLTQNSMAEKCSSKMIPKMLRTVDNVVLGFFISKDFAGHEYLKLFRMFIFFNMMSK